MKYLNSIKKSFWSLVEHTTSPFVTLISTPLLLKFLGVEIYAQYMFVKTLVSMGSIISLTMNQAVTKEISINSNNKEKKNNILNSIRSSITITTLSILLILIIFLPISWNSFPLIFVKIGNKETLHQILIFSLILIYFEQIDCIFSGALKGLDNFRLSAILEFLTRISTLTFSIYFAYLYKDLYKLLDILLLFNFLRLLFKGIMLSRLIGGFVIFFGWNKRIILNLLHFGKWNWIQTIGGTLESSGNRLILASVLGSEGFTIYSICNALSQVIFLVPSAALYWIFPKASMLSSNNKYIPIDFYNKSINANLFISLSLGLFMIFLGKQLLSLWISPAFASENYLFFILLSISWIFISLYISTHNLLLGFGKEKLLGLINFFGGLLSILISYIGINIFGIYGMIFGKLILAVILSKQIPSTKKILAQ